MHVSKHLANGWLPWIGLAVGATACIFVHGADAAEQRAASARAKEAEIAELVGRLGSNDYFMRRDAEQQLLQIGPDAFDALKKAERADDLEVASRAAYILQQLRVEWSRGDDPLEVRQLLSRYDELADDRRTAVIERLSELPHDQGVAALARIARFDASPIVARRAALAVMEMDLSDREAIDHLIEREIGASRRASANWLRTLVVELREPQAATARWRTHAEQEAALLASETDETAWPLLERLWDHELKHGNARSTVVETVAVLIHRVETTKQLQEEPIAGLLFTLDWCLKHERWQVLEMIERRYADVIRASRQLIYYLALAYDAQGKSDLSEKTAEAALRLVADDDEARSEIAAALAILGRLDWAEREWQYVIDNFPEVDVHSVIARFELASWRFDREQYSEAAELLAPSCDAIVGNQAERTRLKKELEDNPRAPELNDFVARRDYYLACHYGAIGDYDREADHLELSAATYPRNIDVLIAMTRAQGGDDQYLARAATRIKKAKRRQEAEIERWNDPAIRDNEIAQRYLAGLYNEWAWLTANTSTDPAELQEAIAASKRSLELRPDEPAFLDTLGRCYFAAGQYENAVEQQRRAVAQEPHLEVMQRQLETFEQALAKQNREDPPAADSPADTPADTPVQQPAADDQ